MGTLLNRRRYMGGGSADEIIMTSESNAPAMAVCYAQGWAASPDFMLRSEAEAVTDIGTAFINNTELVDATFLRYFVNLTALTSFARFQWCGFRGCTSLKAIVIPVNVTGSYDLFMYGTTSMDNVEILEGVTNVCESFLRTATVDRVTIPSTMRALPIYSFEYCSFEDGIVDLRGTAIESIGAQVFYDLRTNTHVLLPSSVLTIGNDFIHKTPNLQYIEFNSDTSLSIGNNVIRDRYNISVTVVFEEDIPITIGDNFGVLLTGADSKVFFHSTTMPTIGSNFFSSSKTTTKIYVPDGYVAQYEAIPNLSGFTILPLSDYIE